MVLYLSSCNHCNDFAPSWALNWTINILILILIGYLASLSSVFIDSGVYFTTGFPRLVNFCYCSLFASQGGGTYIFVRLLSYKWEV